MSIKKINRCLPGWLLMLGIAIVSTLISKWLVIEGKNPIESVLIAIFFGVLIRNLITLPKVVLPGIDAFEKILALGIVFLGLGLNLALLIKQAASAMGITLACVLLAPFLIYFIGKRFGLTRRLAVLLSVGTTICGGTAIAISAPIIKAKDSEISYAIGTIAFFGIGAMILFPTISHFLGLTPQEFGMWAGTSIHSTPQVLGAGFMMGEEAGQTATITKLFRNLFMVPAVFVLALWQPGKKRLTGTQALRAVPWFLFGFLGLVFLRTGVDLTELGKTEGWEGFLITSKDFAKFLILIAMAGIGLRTDLRSVRSYGWAPMWVGFIGSVILASFSLGLIYLTSL